MLQLTDVEISTFAPRALPEYVKALAAASTDMERCGFNRLRLCHFLAQAAHETGGFTLLREDTDWTKKRMCEVWPKLQLKNDPKLYAKLQLCPDDEVAKANFIYSGRTDLGNRPGTDDGYVYRGAYLFQDTGRSSWGEASEACGVDFVGYPEMYNVAQSTKYWVRKWQREGYHKFADRGYIRAIGNKINRGSPYSKHEPNGHADRVNWFNKIWRVMGTPGQPPVYLEGLALGAYGEDVRALQMRLRELGYPLGEPDAVFGPTTARAVAAFKLDYQRQEETELDPAEIVGPATQAALNLGIQVELAPERVNATEKDVIAVSETAAAGKAMQDVGTALVVSSAAAGGAQSGFLDLNAMADTVAWIPAAQATLSPVATATMWGLKNLAWILPLVAGFVVWKWGRKTIAARWRDFVSGFNLGK